MPRARRAVPSYPIMTPQQEILSAHHGEVRRNLKANVAIAVIDGALFFVAYTFVSLETVVPVFVTKLGGSGIAVSMIPFLLVLTINATPILVARRLQQADLKVPVMLFHGFFMRLPWVLLAAVTFLAPPAPVLVPAALLTVLFYGGFAGLSSTPFFDLMGKLIPLSIRGRVFSTRMVIGYLVAIGAAVLATHLLGSIAFPRNYATLFLLGGGIMYLSLLVLCNIRETVYPLKTPPVDREQYWSAVRRVMKNDRRFLKFNIARALNLVFLSSTAFFSSYGITRFNLSDSYAGVFTSVTIASLVVLCPLMGLIGDRRGHRTNLLIAGLGTLGAAILALAAPDPHVYCAAFVLVSTVQAAQFISIMTMVLEFSTPQERPTYFGLSALLMTPVALGAIVLGAVADVLGYRVMFVLLAVIAAAGTAYIWRFVDDPTSRRTPQSARHGS